MYRLTEKKVRQLYSNIINDERFNIDKSHCYLHVCAPDGVNLYQWQISLKNGYYSSQGADSTREAYYSLYNLREGMFLLLH